MKDVNLRTITDTLDVVKDLATRWIQAYPCKTKTSQGIEKDHEEGLGADGRTHKSFTLTITYNLAKLVKSYCRCSHAWTKNSERIPWRVTAICETFKISCLMGEHRTKGASANFSSWASIPLGSLVGDHRFSAKDPSRLPPVREASMARNISRIYVVQGGDLERSYNWSKYLRSWKRWTHQKSTLGDSMRSDLAQKW